MMNKPYAIYRFNQYTGRRGYWERCGAYKTPEAAKQAFFDFIKRPKKERLFVYIILPNTGRERWILVEHHEQLLKTAR